MDPADPHSAGKKMLGYVESQLRSGMTEYAIRDQLLAAQLPLEYITELILFAVRGRRSKRGPDLRVRSGRYDVGGVFNYLADMEKRGGTAVRTDGSAEKSPVWASEPDPAFSLEDWQLRTSAGARGEARSQDPRYRPDRPGVCCCCWFLLLALSMVRVIGPPHSPYC